MMVSVLGSSMVDLRLEPRSGQTKGNVMVSVLGSSMVDLRLELRSGQTKDYMIGICYFYANLTCRVK